MGPSLNECTTTVLGRPGDHTAGLMYTTWLYPLNPLNGTTNMTNYPSGENIWQPTSISSIIPTTLHIILSITSNYICGWNLLILFGYMTSSMLMYSFLKWLTGNIYVSLFSAYAATFTPYHAFASLGQPAGLFGGIFILAIWQFISMWKEPSIGKGIMLGLILGASFYIDGYFILISLVLLLGFWTATIGYGILTGLSLSNIRYRIKTLLIASLTTILALTPLVIIRIHYSNQVASYLGSTRGNIQQEAQLYSASPYMYVMPTKLTPILGTHAKEFQTDIFNNSSEPGLIFVGYSVATLSLIAIAITLRQYLNKNINSGTNFAVLALSIVAFMGFWFSLKPRFELFGIAIYNPSSLIILITSSWRVFGRLYILVDIALVSLAGIGVMLLMARFPRKSTYIMIACALVMVGELRSFPYSSLTSSFSYSDTPPVYGWLANASDVRAIAEYPLDETPQGMYLGDYYTFQQVSKKPILNSYLPNSPQASLRRGLAGINDPQTLPTLRTLGIDLVNIRPLNPVSNQGDVRQAARDNPELELYYSYTEAEHKIDSFRIKPGRKASYFLEIPSLQYFQVSPTPDGSAKYYLVNDTKLSILKLPGSNDTASNVMVSLELSTTNEEERSAVLIQDGAVIWQGILTKQPKIVTASVNLGAGSVTINAHDTPEELNRLIITASRMQVIEDGSNQ